MPAHRAIPVLHSYLSAGSGRAGLLAQLRAGMDRLAPAFLIAGRWMVAVFLAGFAAQQFVSNGYARGIELVPEWTPLHTLAAWLTGALLLPGAVCVASGWTGQRAAVLLACGFALSLALRPVGSLLSVVPNLVERARVAELLALLAGSLILAEASPMRLYEPLAMRRVVQHAAGMARIVLAVCLASFGIAHLQVPDFIASLVPGWIPFPLFWAYATAAVFLIAAITIAMRWWVRPGSAAVGLMLFLWVFILHAPRVAGALHNDAEWNSLFVCLGIAGFCFVLAGLPERGAKVD